jgi:hypothetical protein
VLKFFNNLYKVNKQEQSLYFYGARHCYDSSDMQFIDIASLWEQFVADTKIEKNAFGEIPVPDDLPEDLATAITKYGESGAHYWHALRHSVPALCPEPSPVEQRLGLCAIFPSDEVAYALTIQNLASWFRNTRGRTFQEMIDFTIARESKYSEVYGFVMTNDSFLNTHVRLFGNQALEDQVFLQKLADPRRVDNQINTIIGHRTKIRNEHILQEIQTAWQAGKSIFVVYGLGHFDVLQDRLPR